VQGARAESPAACELLIETAPSAAFAVFSRNSMVFKDGQRPDLGQDVKALFGFVQGFLGSSSRDSKKMLAPLKTRNMFRSDN
jgi:hypothetical protein